MLIGVRASEPPVQSRIRTVSPYEGQLRIRRSNRSIVMRSLRQYMQNRIVIHCQIFEDLIAVEAVILGIRVIECVNAIIEGKE